MSKSKRTQYKAICKQLEKAKLNLLLSSGLVEVNQRINCLSKYTKDYILFEDKMKEILPSRQTKVKEITLEELKKELRILKYDFKIFEEEIDEASKENKSLKIDFEDLGKQLDKQRKELQDFKTLLDSLK